MSRARVAVVVLVQLAALLAVSGFIGDNGWDDGAITLAFARTFAQHGRIALTARSEVVEGFSSVSWFLLNGLAALGRPSFRGAILASQVLASLSICASTLLLARTCRLLRLDALFTTLTLVAFAAWGCSFSEAVNGMEMGLLAAAILVVVNELLSPEPRLWLAAAGAVLAVLTRFEAALYVGLLALSALLLGRRRAFWAIALAGLGASCALTGWRLSVFSDVLPNTFWAKRWPPYSAFGPGERLAGALELARFFWAPLAALTVVTLRGFALRRELRERRSPLLILGAPILGATLMGAAVGRLWGYHGRLPYFAFPLGLALLAVPFSAWVQAGRTRLRAAVAVAVWGCAVATSMDGFPRNFVRDALAGGAFDVTPHTYAASGGVFRRVAAAANLREVSILTPDVGGLALAFDELRIVDLGLLSNRELAHRGPGVLGQVLAAEAPELVEAHWKWPSAGHLYDLPWFRAQYQPAFAGGTKLWLRRDVAANIVTERRGCWVPVDRADVSQALAAHRYAGHDLPEDREAFRRPGVMLALADDPASLCQR